MIAISHTSELRRGFFGIAKPDTRTCLEAAATDIVLGHSASQAIVNYNPNLENYNVPY